MKKLIMPLRILAVLSLAVLVGAFWQESSLIGKAELTQRIKPHDPAMAELLGEVGTPIGEPQRMIIEDASVILPGKGDQGQRLVNDTLMLEKGVYPLQEKTVSYVAGLVKLGSATGAVLCMVAAWLIGRRP
ncbi:MAG: hypothetical protein IT363_14660 [Methanoregulaceae archaeon]|nr:hypothetical protein [Methanoregulaceae archaeon]